MGFILLTAFVVLTALLSWLQSLRGRKNPGRGEREEPTGTVAEREKKAARGRTSYIQSQVVHVSSVWWWWWGVERCMMGVARRAKWNFWKTHEISFCLFGRKIEDFVLLFF